MTPKKPKLFISHSSVDKPFVNRLILQLREAGVPDPWYDIFDLDAATDNIAQALKLGVNSAEWFALVLSPASAGSHWVTYELQAARRAKARAVVLLYDSPQGQFTFLSNPHLNDFLNGGQRKILNFSSDYERALADLLLVVAPKAGSEYDTKLTVGQITIQDDPDLAERAMSYAALNPERFIPPLVEMLPKLRDSAKLRYRVEGTFTAIGSPAVEPLFEFLFRQRVPDSLTRIPFPVAQSSVNEDGVSEYFDTDAISILRHSILTGGNQTWAAQMGASYCLIALAKRDRVMRRSIVDALREELATATSLVSHLRGEHEIDDEFFDVLRMAIETMGRAAASGELDDFLVSEFASTKLWGQQSEHARYKLTSYIVRALSRSGSQEALDRLSKMLFDPENVKVYFEENVSPNPWEHAFVPFGTAAVDRLLELTDAGNALVNPILFVNLANIGHPYGLRRAIDWAAGDEESALLASSILFGVANVRIAAASNYLLDRYLAGDFLRFADSPFADNIDEAIVAAVRSADDRIGALRACWDMVDKEDDSLQVELAKTIPAIGAHELYDQVLGWLSDHPNSRVRAVAAIALSEHHVLRDPEVLLNALEYAEPDIMAPSLGVALSYFKREEAREPLAHGLRVSFLRYDENSHERYADALTRLGSDDALQERKKWYQRI